MRNAMHLRAGVAAIGLAVSGAAWAQTPATTQSSDAPAGLGTMAQEFDQIQPPAIDRNRVNDPSYRAELAPKVREYYARRGDLAVKLLKADPSSPKASTYLDAAFTNFRGTGQMDKASDLVEDLLKRTTNPAVKADCLFVKAVILANKAGEEKAFADTVDQFLAAAPSDERAPQLLAARIELSKDPEEKKKLSARLQEKYPDSPAAAEAKATAERNSKVGKPFELSFNDALTGKHIDMKDLKGKVVVIDFWATWCGPCVAEMPNMKKLYAQYKDKGVEFIGVSLDQPEAAGGLAALKDFCAKQQITWPQYYQGNGWESKFSMSWGIQGIPTMFVVDANGNLADTEARGRLEEILPNLLSQKDKK
ncbi:MAG: redoxin family protein [Tepidisphaeraceae bacterium]